MQKLTLEEMKDVTGGCYNDYLGCHEKSDDQSSVCCVRMHCLGLTSLKCGDFDWYFGQT